MAEEETTDQATEGAPEPAPHDPDEQTVNVVGSGGAELTLALPLGAVYAEQVQKGALTAADEESAEALAPYLEEPEAEAPAEAETGEEAADGPPAEGASKAEWAEYAEAHGIDTEGATKAEIIAAVEAEEE